MNIHYHQINKNRKSIGLASREHTFKIAQDNLKDKPL